MISTISLFDWNLSQLLNAKQKNKEIEYGSEIHLVPV